MYPLVGWFFRWSPDILKHSTSHSWFAVRSVVAALGSAAALSAFAQSPLPYLPDAATLHLWHLNEIDTPVSDFVAEPLSLTALANDAVLSFQSFPHFGTALSTADGGSAGGNLSGAIDAHLAAAPLVNGSGDNVNWSFDDPTTGAFTFEALVRIDFDPAADFGASGTGRNLPMQILSGDQEGSSGVRSFQFRLDPTGFNPNADGLVTPLARPSLEFININGGANVQSFVIPLPDSGVNAIASNQWYHVAVAYSGDETAADNLKFYWTLLETNRSVASLLTARQMTSDLNDSGAVDLCIGNTGRNLPNNNFIGQIDEVRISSTARGSNEFVFRSAGVLEASAAPEPQNPPAAAMDGDLNTRWSANGDGQWITFDLGRAELVESIALAFYLGNIRTTTFDVLLSTDNLRWTTALANVTSSGTNLNLESRELADSIARFVRIVGHGNSSGNGWNSITEVNITRSPLADSDADGLPDVWENRYFTNLIQVATGDPDADTRSNLYEYIHGFDPTVADNIEDTDTDGLPDNWEQLWFGNLNETAEGDPDRDGLTNQDELGLGADPTNPNSVAGDLDGDNLPDAWELAAAGSIGLWAYDDADGDGHNQLAEMIAGTSPTNSQSKPNWVSPRVAFLNDSLVVTNACLMPFNATYGRAINGVAYQNQPLFFNGYQYLAWYDTQGTIQRVWLGRRPVNGVSVGDWEMFNTGSEFTRGDESSWDAHNVIALGICHTDGSLHFSWDHHGHTLRYRRSVPGLCTTNLAVWGAAAINPEQNWLVAAGQSVTGVTYPRFVNTPSGGLRFLYRTGGTSAGDHWLHDFLPATGAWTAGRKFSAKEGTFSDVSLNGGTFTSTSRNAYENDYAFGPDGTLHYTWTYREATPNPSNHDLHYAYSSDGGITWRNNASTVIADTSLGQAIRVDSPGVIAKVINSRQRLINQQGQCVDNDGRVHVLMLHRRVEPGFEWQLGDSAFSTADTAYFHYFRDPATGAWSQRRLPTHVSVGSRPKITFDAQGNVYAVYVGDYPYDTVPGYNFGKLVIASASKASQYTDWEIVQTIDLPLQGEPLVDHARLLQHNLLSVMLQEDSPVTSVVGTPLHVFDFAVNVRTGGALTVNFAGDDVLITLPTETGFKYQLQMSDALGADWANVGNATSGTGGWIALPHADGRDSSQRFYRVLRSAL